MTVMTLSAAAGATNWDAHDTRLIAATVAGIALIVALIVVVKVHPLLALILGSVFVGFAAGVGSAKVVTNFEQGVGDTLKEVGLLIALGAMLGKLLADSGGADQVIDKLLAKAKGNAVPWAMALVAIIIGLPMFFEIGLVLLLPVIVLVTQRSKLPLMRVAIPALGTARTHPATPWPAAGHQCRTRRTGNDSRPRSRRGHPYRRSLRPAALDRDRSPGTRGCACDGRWNRHHGHRHAKRGRQTFTEFRRHAGHHPVPRRVDAVQGRRRHRLDRYEESHHRASGLRLHR
jgi:hypothetical protein